MEADNPVRLAVGVAAAELVAAAEVPASTRCTRLSEGKDEGVLPGDEEAGGDHAGEEAGGEEAGGDNAGDEEAGDNAGDCCCTTLAAAFGLTSVRPRPPPPRPLLFPGGWHIAVCEVSCAALNAHTENRKPDKSLPLLYMLLLLDGKLQQLANYKRTAGWVNGCCSGCSVCHVVGAREQHGSSKKAGSKGVPQK